MAKGIRPRLVPPGTPMSRPLVAGHLHVGLDWVDGDEVLPLRSHQLHRLGLTEDQAFELAAEWLEAAAGSDELRAVDTVDGMWFLSSADGSASVRIGRLTEQLEPLGGLLAAVPSRNQLLVVPVDSMTAVDALRVMASAVGTAFDHASEPVSDQLFWHDGDDWHLVELHRDLGGDVTVLPPAAFFERVRQVASMDLVRVVGEA